MWKLVDEPVLFKKIKTDVIIREQFSLRYNYMFFHDNKIQINMKYYLKANNRCTYI